LEIVLTHIGPTSLPDYVSVTIGQIRRFNMDVVITFIANEDNLNRVGRVDSDVNLVDERSVRSARVSEMLLLLKRREDDFWGVTTSRILYVEEYMRVFNKENIIHFENDVLLYFDLRVHWDAMLEFKSLAITKGGVNQIMTGFFYIKSYFSLKHMIDFWMGVLRQHTIKELRRRFGVGMMNEMTLFFIYSQCVNEDYLDYFPILPRGEYSYNIDRFNSLFDPASYGQFVGGTDSKKEPGFLDKRHYIGREMLLYPNDYGVIWDVDEAGRRCPYLVYTDGRMRINNLHIHSKNLWRFI